MRPIVIGCNHKTAPLNLREKMSFDAEATGRVLDELRREFDGCEAVVLSTCNRSEFYLTRLTHGRPRREDLVAFLSTMCLIPVEELNRHVYYQVGRGAIEHLFRVVCSLDSMVVGETQIVNQVKQAMARATDRGACGRTLGALFQWALHVAKEVRSETEISAGQVSVGSVAAQFARQIFGRFGDKTVLMIGAGEMGELTLQHVLTMKPRQTMVVNRTLERAEQVAARFAAQAFGLDRLDHCLGQADVVITSTGAAHPILTRSMIAKVLSMRGYAPLLIVDIAVPRDVEPGVGDLDNVYLYNIDDLQGVVEAGLNDRRQQIGACDEIVARHVDEFIRWRDTRAIGPAIQALRQRLTGITEVESQWARPKLSGNPHHDAQILDQLLHRIVGKILHGPTRALGQKVEEGGVDVYVESLRRLFDLPEDDGGPSTDDVPGDTSEPDVGEHTPPGMTD